MRKLLVVICIFFLFSSCGHEISYNEPVKKMGYEDVSDKPVEIVSVLIPETFNDVYKRYNSLQQEGGYDLSLYKGKECIRYTYPIPSLSARANILVYDGKIIGGDICGITLDGIMIPIKKYDGKS